MDSKAKYIVRRALYNAQLSEFRTHSVEHIVGTLTAGSIRVEQTQSAAWAQQVVLVKEATAELDPRASIYFEYSVPRLGKRIDCLILFQRAACVMEFKVGEHKFLRPDIDQVWDYALDLKNFHETSHNLPIVPVLIATKAAPVTLSLKRTVHDDLVMEPVLAGKDQLRDVLSTISKAFVDSTPISVSEWEEGRYRPTPTIIEAARALYANHSVTEISRSDAGAINLAKTSQAIDRIISKSQLERVKSICFVTGVPGAGKTLVGLDVANRHMDKESASYSVFLSGNGPLVAVLREALSRDLVGRRIMEGSSIRKGEARKQVSSFIQNVHHFRDECLADRSRPPVEHVVLFDEAQRAWNLEQTRSFMTRKKGYAGFDESEPEFLISCMNRHTDWATVVCLVGGGQEINTGEAGIVEWIDALHRRFCDWHVHVSPGLYGSEHQAPDLLNKLRSLPVVNFDEDLHLSVSMRSFRAESLSEFVKLLLELDQEGARKALLSFQDRYPIVLTRSVESARNWLRTRARGSERYGLVVSSQAQRLKPHAIDVRVDVDPVHWFLGDKDDTRSSYYLEDVATEFHVQGLELDWAGVVWDGDLRFSPHGWQHKSFIGKAWQSIRKSERQQYLVNAYRVLMTRARQGMVIVVPESSEQDPTRSVDVYDSTFGYLKSLGIPQLEL